MRARVIDDSRAMRMVLARMLTNLGFEVDQAADGVLGLQDLAAGAAPVLIMVDWHMPELEGIDFAAAAAARSAPIPRGSSWSLRRPNPLRSPEPSNSAPTSI